MTSLALEAPFLLAALLLVGGMARLFAVDANAAAWVLVAVTAVTGVIVPAYDLSFTQAGVTIFVLDVITGVMFAIGVTRLVSDPEPLTISLPVAAWCALLLIHVGWGALTFGLQAAVNGSRAWLYLVGPIVFGLTVRSPWTRRSFLPLIVCAVSLSCFALIQIGQHGLYGANNQIEVRGEFVDARPVNAEGALLIVQCILIAASAGFVRTTRWWVAILVMGAASLLLQHRTVWLVALFVVVIAYTKWARIAIFTNERAALGAASVILLVLPIVIVLVGSSSAFADSIDSATGGNSTLEWRTKSWSELIAAHHSTQDILAGLPSGHSFERRIKNVIVTQSPHSVYVDALLMFGALGPLILVWLGAVVVHRRRIVSSALGISSAVVTLVIVSEALFGVVNMLGPLQALMAGMLLQAARSLRPLDSSR